MKITKDFIKKNIVSLLILFAIFILIMLNIFNTSSKEEISLNTLKDYANELRSKGLYLQAIDAYKQYLKNTHLSKKISANVHYFIGDIYKENLKDFDKALAHFIKIKYIHPDSPLLNNINQKIITCLENSGRSREAQIALQETTALNGKKNKNLQTPIAKIDSDIITLADFNHWINELPEEIKKNYKSSIQKKELFRQYIGQELMYRMALRKGFQNDPYILKKSFEIKKNLMAQKLMQEELLSKIKITMKDIELYYKANKDKYKKPLNQIINIVQQDIMQEKVQEKSQELLSKMIKANSVQIFDDNIR